MRKSQIKLKDGSSYGVITLMSVAEEPSSNKVKKWNCKCKKCNKLFQYTGSQVLKYQTVGCPDCREKIKTEQRIIKANSYSDMVFNNLKVIVFDHFDKKNMPVVQCQCLKCGAIVKISLYKILSGESKQCFNCSKKNLKIGKEIISKAFVDNTSIIAIDGRRKTNKNSTTKVTGVSYYDKYGKYREYINFQRKQYYLGLYEKIDDALKARKSAEENIYGNFLKWYQDTYPEEWKRIKMKTK